jgi:uncharacterized damage-inducible protein DinB
MPITIDEFLSDWKAESGSTAKILAALTDESLVQRVTSDGRSLGFLAWHIVHSIGEMGSACGLPLRDPGNDAPAPMDTASIRSEYARVSTELAEAVRREWNDAMLLETIDMYGQRWSRGETLSILLRHEIHHRGQMTVLMRQAGLRVPGVCGPSKEEWAEMGMPPMP